MRALALALLLGTALAASDTVPAAGGDITITPLIHASVQIEHAGRVIQVDPWSLGDLSLAKPADLILITDDQGHHLDVAAIGRLRKPGAPVVIPAQGAGKVPDGLVLSNGESRSVGGVLVESIAAYDIIQGEPSHPKGEANGYLITLGGTRIYVAGVTECVPEVRALRNIDVAFVPMNIPLGRMLPPAAAACVKTIRPKVVYIYHYDQEYASQLANPRTRGAVVPHPPPIVESLLQFRQLMAGEAIEIRDGTWYPARY